MNGIVGFTAPLIWFMVPWMVLLLWFMPQLADTPTNLDMNNHSIPFDYYNNEFNLLSRLSNPMSWLLTISEVTIDFFHSLTYIFNYWIEYFQTDKNTFPSIKYAGRSGSALAKDLIDIFGWLYTIQVAGTPVNIFFGIVSIPCFFLLKYGVIGH